jgi:hypothetical protein
VASGWHKARTAITRTPRHLEEAFERSRASASWLTPADELTCELVRDLLRAIDDIIFAAERTDTLFPGDQASPLADEGGKISYPASNVIQLLDRLGLTPQGRANLKVERVDDDDALVELEDAYRGVVVTFDR